MFYSLKLLLLILFCSTSSIVSSSRSRKRSNSKSSSSSDEVTEDCITKYRGRSDRKRNARQICIVKDIYESLIYPESYNIAIGLSTPPGFGENVNGRITPVGVFNDLDSSIEYFYALTNSAPILSGNTVQTDVVLDVTIIFITSYENLVSVRVDLTLDDSDAPDAIRNITQTGFFVFNDDGNEVISYDLTLLRLGEFVDFNFEQTDPNFIVNILCGVEAQFCLGDLDEYDTFNDCVNYLLNEIPLSNGERFNSNSLTCRNLHSVLVPLRPEVHCNHIGRNSTTCVDEPYEDWYEVQFPAE